MGVWDDVENLDYLARMVSHPSRPAVATQLIELIGKARAVRSRGDSRTVQEDLLEALLDAEGQLQAARREQRRGGSAEWDVAFWRRTCVQLRSVGDAIAWRFLEYRRQVILLLGTNQSPGLLTGKSGTAAEIAAFRSRWDAGQPTLLNGLTSVITIGDLLVDEGDGAIRPWEVKTGRGRLSRRQRDRMIELHRQLTVAPRIRTENGVSYILQSSVPLRSFWSSAVPEIGRSLEQGVATWVPAPGVAVMFTPAVDTGATRAEAEALLAQERARASDKMGSRTHTIVVRSAAWPFRARRAVPPPLLPIPVDYAAGILLGMLPFMVEVSVDMMAAELRRAGLEATIALEVDVRPLAAADPVLRWRRGTARGLVHTNVLQQLALELVEPGAWAQSFRSTVVAPPPERSFGTFICLSDERAVWA